MIFQCINIRQIPREVLKPAASDMHEKCMKKKMFDPYIVEPDQTRQHVAYNQAYALCGSFLSAR